MSGQLTRRIDLLRDAERGRRLDGALPSRYFERLGQAADEVVGDVRVSLTLSRDELDRVVCSGEADAVVATTCQRCLSLFEMPLKAVIALGWARDEAAAERLPPTLEPLLSESGVCDLVTLVEDELLLAMPVAPRHDRCQPDRWQAAASAESAAGDPVESRRQSPFQLLASLRGRDGSNR